MSQNEVVPARARARFEISDDLPDGMIVVPVERAGEIVWLVRRGEMTDELIEQVNDTLTHVTRHGLWGQNWGGPVSRIRPYARLS